VLADSSLRDASTPSHCCDRAALWLEGGQARPGGAGGDRGSIGILRWRLADDERAGKIPHKVASGLPPKLGAKEDRGVQPDKRSLFERRNSAFSSTAS
jgi:hypothetical protein